MNGLSFVLLLILTSGAAVVIHTDPQPQAVLIGGVVNMTCVIEASYNISIEWLKDDVIIETASKPFITITTTPPSSDVGNYTSTLSISSVWFDSCGKYMCSASGMNSAAVDVNVVDHHTMSGRRVVTALHALPQQGGMNLPLTQTHLLYHLWERWAC
jgi:hypothetical protein